MIYRVDNRRFGLRVAAARLEGERTSGSSAGNTFPACIGERNFGERDVGERHFGGVEPRIPDIDRHIRRSISRAPRPGADEGAVDVHCHLVILDNDLDVVGLTGLKLEVKFHVN